MRHAFPILLLSLAAPVAWAGTVYRCVDRSGDVHFVETRLNGHQCKLVARFDSSASPSGSVTVPPMPAAPVPAAAPASAAPGTDGKAPATGGEPKFLRMGHSTTYVWADAEGVRHFASRRPPGIANVQVKRTSYPIFSIPGCYACGVAPGVDFGNVRLNLQAFRGEVQAAAQRHGVDEAIVRAIIHAESAFRPHVVSPKNAQGLMQLIPATARRFGVRDAFDPAQNIEGGVKYLAWLLKRYNGDLTMAAAGYNAGEGAVERYKGVPPYRETRQYVARVGQLAERYRKALKSG
ncbi:MAG: transglycosylase SLT domain-containing protein [Arenimonas sp.]